MLEYLPFWAAFFNRLGCAVSLSPDSGAEVLEKGLRELPAETCFPIKLAFGHVKLLLDRDVDWIFFPSLVERHENPKEEIYLCPYGEHVPFMVRSVLGKKLLTPSVPLNSGAGDFVKSLGPLKGILGRDDHSLESAFREAWMAQKAFAGELRARGEEVLEKCLENGLQIWAVLGKPYNVHDPFLNLNLGKHLQRLEVLALPIDFIPTPEESLSGWESRPVWRYNQEIIQAALWCAEKPSVFPLILSNFGCGPDALSTKHVEKILERTPHLLLEFDEHRAEAGLLTRLEAFRDEVTSSPRDIGRPGVFLARKKEDPGPASEYAKRPFILPYFSDHAYAFAGALTGVGISAQILPPPDEETFALGERFSSGKECHAFSIMAGDLAKFAQSPRRGGEVFFFPGARYACLVTQFEAALNYLLQDLGVRDLTVLTPPMEPLSKLLGVRGLTLLWRGLVATDLLIKAACERRPYEIHKGMTDLLHQQNLRDIENGLGRGSFEPALERCAERLKSIPVRKGRRPLVGIAGDLYTRQHPVANHNLFLKLEAMGCEVWPSPFIVAEVDFGLKRSFDASVAKLRLHEAAAAALLILKKEVERWKVAKILGEALPRLREPSSRDILEFVSPYVGRDNNQTLLLNIAKMVDFARRGADGVVNAICFNCMLGTVSEALSAQIRRDYKSIPLPTLIYGTTELSSEKLKLEAFVYQVQQFAKKKAASRRSERGKG